MAAPPMIDHGLTLTRPTAHGVEALCSCGESRERATEPKARRALDFHIARKEIEAGNERARGGG